MAHKKNEHPEEVGEREPSQLPDIVVEIEPSLWLRKCCIYKVPENLRMQNREAYTPQLISIGPIHRKLKKLWPMENEKKRYYRKFFGKRLSIKTQEGLDILNLRELVSDNVKEIKHCYSEKYDDTSREPPDEFVNMILLDAVFIIELFLRNSDDDYMADYLFALPFLKNGIQRDLSLLENQLPFFFLNKLYDTLIVPKGAHRSFLHLAHKYFANMRGSGESLPVLDQNEIKHFTHLIRCYYLPSDFQNENSDSTYVCRICPTKASNSYAGSTVHRTLKPATKLNDAGVTFKQPSNKSLLDISFEKNNLLNSFPCLSCLPFLNCVKARFEIPQLTVDDNTEYIFRNLIAFEQCHFPYETYICNYTLLLDSLIDGKEDVELLVEKEIIIHGLGSNEEVAAFFNNLGKQVFTRPKLNCYGYVIDELNKHYNNNWNHTIAKLRSVYFCDLWRGSSTVVGIAVLFFTFFSFFHSIF